MWLFFHSVSDDMVCPEQGGVTVDNGDVTSLECSVDWYGNKAPSLQWFEEDDTPISDAPSYITINNRNVTYVFLVHTL